MTDPAAAVPVRPAPFTLPWREALVGLWLLGALVGAVGLARDLRAARRLRKDSWPAGEPALEARFETLRRRLRVRPRVELRLSDRIPGPLTVGLVRPAVVLPRSDAARLSPAELDMALAHELLHVRRLDLWAGWIPGLARCLFFFHPLATLAAREYRVAREAACDAAVLEELGTPPGSYGRLLLRWTRRRPGPATATGVAVAGASSSFLDLKRRLEMLHEPISTSWRTKVAAGALAGITLAALVPLRLVAQAPTPPTPPEAPPAPHASTSTSTTTSSTWTWTDDDGEAWALIEGGRSSGVWMSGSSDDWQRVDALRDRSDGPFLWFRHDGREYVVRDRATLARARKILEPQMELGRRQGELGSRQGELGARQGELGARQGDLGAQQGQLGAQQAEIAADMARLAADRAQLQVRRTSAEQEEREEYESQAAEIKQRAEPLRDQMEELGRRQKELGARQAELGRQQAELGEKQAALGKQQKELGRQQEKVARQVRAQLGELAEQAIADGLAEPVR